MRAKLGLCCQGDEIAESIPWQSSLHQLPIRFHSLDAFQCIYSNHISLRNEGPYELSQAAPYSLCLVSRKKKKKKVDPVKSNRGLK